MFKVIAQKQRSGHGEIFFHGAISLFDGENFFNFCDDPMVYGRSLMKPFQIQMFREELSDLTSRQTAIAVASHNGTAKHIKEAQSILSEDLQTKLALTETSPLETGCKTSIWTNPCSGKHCAIVRGLEKQGIDATGYNQKDHDYNKAYRLVVEKYCNTSLQTRAIDGCSLPTYLQSLSSIAKGFYNVYTKQEFSWIRQAMLSHPFLVGGNGRIDTELMSIKEHTVLAKEGADGLLVFSFRDTNNKTWSASLKLASGRNEEAMKYIAAKILEVFSINYTNGQSVDLVNDAEFTIFLSKLVQ